ncbi:MAG: hypothetical protein AAFN93_13945 [Bacteroidota bacterium]
MRKLVFNIEIDSPVESVYCLMISDKGFRKWTSVLAPGSYFDGSWIKGEKIAFILLGDNGLLQGRLNAIQENIPFCFIHIQPYGIIQDGKGIFEGEQVEELDLCYEKYSFQGSNNRTKLSVELGVYDELYLYFRHKWPMALDKLKSICEEVN